MGLDSQDAKHENGSHPKREWASNRRVIVLSLNENRVWFRKIMSLVGDEE